jgi:hypothetical protein
MLSPTHFVKLENSYRGGRSEAEAVISDLVCREAPRLIANLEEYPEASRLDFASQGRGCNKCEVGEPVAILLNYLAEQKP